MSAGETSEVVLVLLVAVLALLAALLTGGAAPGRGLALLRLRAVRLLVAAAVVQVATSVLAPGSGVARTAALVATVVLVGLFVYGNRAVPGVALIAVGLLLNLTVIAVNAAMPVSLYAAARAGLDPAELALDTDALREPKTAATRLGVLGDVVPVALPGRPQVVSPGDVLVAAGVGLLLLTGGAAQSGRTQPTRRAERSTVLDSDSTTIGSYS